MPAARPKLKVLKTLAPGQDGTHRLTRQYGPTLICVRHRTDAQRRRRYVTVELIVDTIAVKPRQPRAPRMVYLHLQFNESDLRNLICAAGAVHDPKTGLWVISHRAAAALDLLGRVVLP